LIFDAPPLAASPKRRFLYLNEPNSTGNLGTKIPQRYLPLPCPAVRNGLVSLSRPMVVRGPWPE